MLSSASTRFGLRVLAFSPLLAAVIVLNYCVDPANVFHSGVYESSVVDVLLTGSNVDRYKSGDERLLERLYVERVPRAHDVVAIGSSRLLQLRAAQFPGRLFFNHSVSGATLRDAVALYGLLRLGHRLPRTVILGLDPWSFSPGREDGLAHSLWREYRDTAAAAGVSDRLRRPGLPFAEWMELLSMRSFQTSVSTLIGTRGRVGREVAVATTHDTGEWQMKRTDGSVSYAADWRRRSPETVRSDAERLVRESPYFTISFAAVDPALVHLCEALLKLMKQDDVAVVLWRSPLHPAVYDALTASAAKRPVIDEFEAVSRRLAEDAHAPLVGSFDPALASLSSADFYDGLHPTAEAVARIAASARLETLASQANKAAAVEP